MSQLRVVSELPPDPDYVKAEVVCSVCAEPFVYELKGDDRKGDFVRIDCPWCRATSNDVLEAKPGDLKRKRKQAAK